MFDSASQGVSKTYLYELMDAYVPGSPQGDSGWGLFDYTETAKPIASALDTLTTVLQDSGADAMTFTPASFHYSVEGLASTGNSLLLQKSNGQNIIAVWNEPQIWNAATHQEIEAPITPVTIDLGQMYASVSVIDPLVGVDPISQSSNVSVLTISVSDHPLLIEVGPTTTSSPTATTPDTPPSSSAGLDTLVLNVSETPANGQDAQFTVSVDGTQIGGVQTVTAKRALAQSQNVTLQGSFGAGPHTVTVNFLDGFATSADAGRTLYIHALSLDGNAIFTDADIQYSGPYAYTLTKPAVPLVSNAGTQDTLILNVSETAASGADAQFLVRVDGQLVGGLQTVTASAAASASQDVVLTGNFGSGPHQVTIDFVNGFGGRPTDAGRILYVNAISLNYQTTFLNFAMTNGSADVTVSAPATALLSNAGTQDTLVLTVAEAAANNEHAQFMVSVDGQLVGGIQTVTASAAAGASQNISLTGDFGAGPHTVAVDFLNGFTGNPLDFARTLYVNALTLDDATAVENAVQINSGVASYSLSSFPTAPVGNTDQTTANNSDGSTMAGTQPAAPPDTAPPVQTVNLPIVFNWNPSTQLTNFLHAEAAVSSGTPGARAKIIALGDSTTVGAVGTPGGRDTVSYPAQLADALQRNGLVANSNNFLGGIPGIDSRLTLVGSSEWAGAQGAGGQMIQTTAPGDGLDFQPNISGISNRVEVQYFDHGNGSAQISINGGSALATLQAGNSDTMKTITIDVPATEINEVSIRATTANNLFIEGVNLWDSNLGTTEVYNAGVNGAASSVVGPLTGLGELAGTAELSPNLALIDYGINDINNAEQTIPQIVSNIEQMVSELRSIDCDPVVLMPTAVVGRTAEFSDLRSALQVMAVQDNVPIIDLSATFGNDATALQAAGLMVDNVHPSPKLYAEIGSDIANLLTAAVNNGG